MTQGGTATGDETRDVVERYLSSSQQNVKTMAPDVVFRDMGTGQEYRTPEGALGMVDYSYRVAFDAHAEQRNMLVSEGLRCSRPTSSGVTSGTARRRGPGSNPAPPPTRPDAAGRRESTGH